MMPALLMSALFLVAADDPRDIELVRLRAENKMLRASVTAMAKQIATLKGRLKQPTTKAVAPHPPATQPEIKNVTARELLVAQRAYGTPIARETKAGTKLRQRKIATRLENRPFKFLGTLKDVRPDRHADWSHISIQCGRNTSAATKAPLLLSRNVRIDLHGPSDKVASFKLGSRVFVAGRIDKIEFAVGSHTIESARRIYRPSRKVGVFRTKGIDVKVPAKMGKVVSARITTQAVTMRLARPGEKAD